MQGLVTEDEAPAAVRLSGSPTQKVSGPVSPGKKSIFFKLFTGKAGNKKPARKPAAPASSPSKTKATQSSASSPGPKVAIAGVKMSPPNAAEDAKAKLAPVRPTRAKSPDGEKLVSKAASPGTTSPPTSPAKKGKKVVVKARKPPPRVTKSPARVAPQPPAPVSPTGDGAKKRVSSARVQSPARGSALKQQRRPVSIDGSKIRRPVSTDRSKAKRPASTGGSKVRRPVSTDMSKARRPVSSGAARPKRPSSAGGVKQGGPPKATARKPASPPVKKVASQKRPVSPTAKKVTKKKVKKKASSKRSGESPAPPTQQEVKKEVQQGKEKEGRPSAQLMAVSVAKEDPAVDMFAGDLVVNTLATMLNGT